MSAYAELEGIFRRLNAVRGASAMLGWDANVMLPTGSADVRGEQLAALSEITHEMVTDPKIAYLLDSAETEDLTDWQRANIREMRRGYVHENALPTELVAELTRASTMSEMAWREARKNNDFAAFAPHLELVLKLTREAAAAKAEALGLSPYDALIDQYDPGSSQAIIDPLFDDLATFLPEFTNAVIEKQSREPQVTLPQGVFLTSAQSALSAAIMGALGFDFNRGRLDISAHPFCGGVPGDVRLTTRYNESTFLPGIFGVVHETGHALYEMHLPADWRSQPVGEARGMGVHESQSLFFEKQIAHNPAFYTFLAPLLRQHLGADGDAWAEENLIRVANKVERSFIRVDADEVTYPSHILLRYKLEKALLANELEVSGLPEAWNAGMQELLGLTPATDRDGCLQDIHWPGGAFGYFPSYTLGAMLAAQLMASLREQLPDVENYIARGEFVPVTAWLSERIHTQGSFLATPELIQQATGKPLDVEIYKNHLKNRYLESL